MTTSATPAADHPDAAEPSVRRGTLRLLRTLFGESTDGALAMHANGCRVFSNRALDAVVATDARQPIGTTAPPPYVPPDQQREYWRLLGETGYVLETGAWASASLEVVSRDRRRTAVELTIFPFPVADTQPLAVWLFRSAPAHGADLRLESSPAPARAQELAVLTPREQEVLDQLLAGRRVASMARALFVSEHTVRNHLKSIFRKLHAHSQAELIDRYNAL
jgi:DNA-binding CsgD family transcriptional regulator